MRLNWHELAKNYKKKEEKITKRYVFWDKNELKLTEKVEMS